MLKQLFDTCIDNDFDDVEFDGDGLTCNLRSFDSRYRLAATARGGVIELALADRAPLAAAPEGADAVKTHKNGGCIIS